MVGHALIGEYHLCFHPGEPMACWCPPHPLQTRDHIFHICPWAQCVEDWEPPFSQMEVLEFCKLNDWVFAFPPLMDGNQIEWVVWCCLLVGDTSRPMGWLGGCQLGVMVLMGLYGEATLSGISWEMFMEGDPSAA